MSAANTMYRAARKIALTGQPVFPCQVRGERAKRPYIKGGFTSASTDPAQLKAWWSQFRGAAIGIPTGIKWDVLDVDVKNEADGRVHLTRLTELGLLNGCQRVIRTPSGGFHLYFNASPGLRNKARTEIGLDVRSHGGYVLAPPSYIETDDYEGAYEDEGMTTDATDEPLLWDLILSAIAPVNETSKAPVQLLPSERRASLAALREWLSIRQPGERNHSLHWAVCRCIENGLDPNELIEPAILCGLGEEEISATINSALRRAGLTAQELDTEAEALFPAT